MMTQLHRSTSCKVYVNPLPVTLDWRFYLWNLNVALCFSVKTSSSCMSSVVGLLLSLEGVAVLQVIWNKELGRSHKQ